MPAPITAELVARETIAAGISRSSSLCLAPTAPSRLQGRPVRLDLHHAARARCRGDSPPELLDRLAERRRRTSSLHHPRDPRGKSVRVPDDLAARLGGEHDRPARLLRAGRQPPRRHRIRRHGHRHLGGHADAGRAGPAARGRQPAGPLPGPVGGPSGSRPVRAPGDRRAGRPRRRRATRLFDRARADLDRRARPDPRRPWWTACPAWSRRPSTWSATAR